jgi:hypothetical protein
MDMYEARRSDESGAGCAAECAGCEVMCNRVVMSVEGRREVGERRARKRMTRVSDDDS